MPPSSSFGRRSTLETADDIDATCLRCGVGRARADGNCDGCADASPFRPVLALANSIAIEDAA
jgi:hypothetical protein